MPASSSDLLVQVTLAAALAAFATAVLLLLVLVALRVARSRSERHMAAQMAAWRDALHLAIYAPQESRLPAIAPGALPGFLRLWNHLRESLRGEAGENLAALLCTNGLDHPVRELARHGNLGERLSAITTLGHLHDRKSWDMLAVLAAQPDAVLSFAAARALLRIDPARALDLLLEDAARREDWSLSRLGAALQEIGPDVTTPALVKLLRDPPAQGLVRLLELARFAHREQIAGTVRGWLGASTQEDVLGTALDFLEEERDRFWARAATQHPAWRVRMAAANALGRIGSPRDLALLLDLVEDKSWWVRYRAARAIADLPGMSRAEVESLRTRTQDRFAADMLAQVLAERAA